MVGLYLKSVFRLTQMLNSANDFHISIDHANIVSVSNENSRSHCFKRPTKCTNRSTVKLRYCELHLTLGKAPVHVNWYVRFKCVSNGVLLYRVSTSNNWPNYFTECNNSARIYRHHWTVCISWQNECRLESKVQCNWLQQGCVHWDIYDRKYHQDAGQGLHSHQFHLSAWRLELVRLRCRFTCVSTALISQSISLLCTFSAQWNGHYLFRRYKSFRSFENKISNNI